MRLWRVVVASVLCVVGAVSGYAETRDIQLRFLDTRNGLSHQSVTCFCEDEFGFIWIGTQNGLNRFDGSSVDSFLPDNTPGSIKSNNIRKLVSDRKGSIYISSINHVERYDLRLGRFEPIYEGQVSSICLYRDQLCIAANDVILRYDAASASGKTSPAFRLDTLYRFGESSFADLKSVNNMVSRGDSLLLTSAQYGLIGIRQGEMFLHRPMGPVNSLMIDDDGAIWVAFRQQGLGRLSTDGTWRSFTHDAKDDSSLIDNNVRSIQAVGDHFYYVGTYSGLQLLDMRTGRFTTCSYDPGIDGFNVRSIVAMLYDDHETLWMGTFHRGVQYYNLGNDVFRFYRTSGNPQGGFASSLVSAIDEDGEGNIWFSTESSSVSCGLFCYNTQTETFSPCAGLSSKIVKSILYRSDDNSLWAATLFNGMNRIDLYTGRVQHVSDKIYDRDGVVQATMINPVKMVQDEDRNLLLASNIGVVRLNCRRMRLEIADDLPQEGRYGQVWDLARSGKSLWIATSYGLFRADEGVDSLRQYTFAEISGMKANYYIKHITSVRRKILRQCFNY